jgi:hypothetical protein
MAISVTIKVKIKKVNVDSLVTDGGKIVSPAYRPRFTPQKHYFSASGTQFC